MNCYFVYVPILVAFLCQVGSGQEWAKKMFTETRHSFGTVARGAKSEYEFELTNVYKEDIHIASVRASCGCATPTITKQWLKTWEKGGIHIRFNTGSFLGQRAATITVTIDRPYYAEVQLAIDGFIRSDVVVEPGAVQFGSVDQGGTAERRIKINYAGRSDWAISDVRSANPNLQVEIVDQQRSPGRSQYELAVRMVSPRDPGFFKDQMVVITNDPHASELPIMIEGNVESLLTVSPASLFLGNMAPGESVTKQLVVRAKSPFRITSIRSDNGQFEFNPSEEAKTLHLVPVKYTAGEQPGELVGKISIETDRGPGVVGNCTATAQIVEPKPETTVSASK